MKKIALIVAVIFASVAGSTHAFGQVFASVQITVAPPALPVYVQPECPVDGYLWAPGYWAYNDGYYWVPGAWLLPAREGYLWTPGYWGYEGNYYGWHGGYWGETVGFYGGVNYGYGYSGSGFYGGRWESGHYRYNSAVVSVNTRVIHNTYVNNTVARSNGGGASFNGKGGVTAQPNANEKAAMNSRHVQATSEQQSHQAAAGKDKAQYASVNNGKPATAAMPHTNTAAAMHAATKPAEPQHTAPASQQHNSTAPQQHTNTPPQQHSNPTPSQHNNPAPQQRANTAPQQHSNPAPQPHNNPTPQQHSNPAPQQHSNPAPQQHNNEEHK